MNNHNLEITVDGIEALTGTTIDPEHGCYITLKVKVKVSISLVKKVIQGNRNLTLADMNELINEKNKSAK